jgi:vancomycin resistance protein YoaR
VTQEDSKVAAVEGKQGEVLDIKKTIKSINRLLGWDWDKKGTSVRATVTYIDPDVTKQDLADITDLLGSYSTFYGSDGSGRSQNIERGAALINGTLLKPGEEFSADAAMRPYTEENGFTEAASYEDDKVVQSMGGGICQISTTLYNAVLYAELEVTERFPHTMLVAYVQPSMDAAIADDVKDLKFKNNQQTSIYIEGIVADGNLTFNIYGKETRNPGRTLDFISETTNQTEPQGKLVKVVYQDGAEQSREVINYSEYVPSKETIAVGTASENQEYADKINNAVQTQDETQIMKAIQAVTGQAAG